MSPDPPSTAVDEAWAAVREGWAAAVIAVGVAVQAYSVRRVLPPLTPGTRPWLLDSLVFEYVGWFLASGGRLYVEVWEIKPPLAFEAAALLALVAPGQLAYHALAVVVTNAAVVASALLVGALAARLTDEPAAGLVAGLSMYALPAYHWRAAFGFKAKYFVVAFGLLALVLALRERPFAAGLSAGASVGFWQVAVVFPALVVGLAARRGRAPALRAAAGVAVAATVMVAPVVLLWDAAGAMVAEVVLAPLLVTEPGAPLGRLRFAALLLGHALPVVAAGGYGLARCVRAPYRPRAWWAPAGAAWFLVQVLLFDFDSYPDLFLLFPFVALGAGVAAGADGGRARRLAGVVALVAAVNVAFLGAPWISVEPFHLNDAVELREPPMDRVERPVSDRTVRQLVFWNGIPTDTCRLFLGRTQLRLVRAIDGDVAAGECGDLGRTWRAVVERYAG